MKKIFTLIATAILITSCAKNEAEKKAEKIKELKESKEEIQTELNKINEELAKLEVKKESVVLVAIQKLETTVFNHYLDIQGNVDTKENILIQPEIPGTLVSLNVKAGQRVGKGQVLGRVDDAGMSSQLASIENQAALAKTSFDRQKNLWDQKIGSEIQYLQAQTQMISAQKSVQQMRSQLSKTIIKAPFSGTIDGVFVERGQVVAPSMQGLMRIVNLANMFVSTSVPESYVGKLKIGTAVNVFIASINKTYIGKVRMVGSNINPSNRSFDIEVSVSNPDNLLRPNQVAKLQITDYTNKLALVVPTNIILSNGDGTKFVYTAAQINNQSGVVKKNEVTVGKSSAEGTEILSGLDKNATLITEGINTLSDGMKINF